VSVSESGYSSKLDVSSSPRTCSDVPTHYQWRDGSGTVMRVRVGVGCGVWGVGCVVCGVWCVVCGVWCVVCGVWCVVCGVWCGVCGQCADLR
jgi:hypothetical protein